MPSSSHSSSGSRSVLRVARQQGSAEQDAAWVQAQVLRIPQAEHRRAIKMLVAYAVARPAEPAAAAASGGSRGARATARPSATPPRPRGR